MKLEFQSAGSQVFFYSQIHPIFLGLFYSGFSSTLLQSCFVLFVGASVNAQNSQYENWTPLCFAILKGNMEIVQILVSAHANVNLGGTAPLLLAVSFNNMEIVEYLLTHGKQKSILFYVFIEERCSLTSPIGLIGSNPTQKSLHGDAAITFAADVGNYEWVKRFHLLGCDVVCVCIESRSNYTFFKEFHSICLVVSWKFHL
jgi:ankyrin repeat protein